MYLQAYEYERLDDNLDLSEFFSGISIDGDTNENIIKSCLKELIDIRDKKQNHLPFNSNLNTILKFHLNN